MAYPIKTCVVCKEEFELKPDKPGFANRCPDCSEIESSDSKAAAPWMRTSVRPRAKRMKLDGKPCGIFYIEKIVRWLLTESTLVSTTERFKNVKEAEYEGYHLQFGCVTGFDNGPWAFTM